MAEQSRLLVIGNNHQAERLSQLTDFSAIVLNAVNLQAAFKIMQAAPVDVVVLPMKEERALEACSALRDAYPQMGIFVMLDRHTDETILRIVDAGADDYAASIAERDEIAMRLTALTRRVKRRSDMPPPPGSHGLSPLAFGSLQIDLQSREVRVHGRRVNLTPKELAILSLLARASGKAVARIDLLKGVFFTDFRGYARNIDCHVTRVRKKLLDAGIDADPIETVHGHGYRFNPEKLTSD